MAGTEPLTVILDSVDEMSLPLPALLRHLRERLRGADLGRLRLRVVCRSGGWPQGFEAALQELYGKDLEVRTLWPLRRADVLAAALDRFGADQAEVFLSTVRRRDVQALAARPTTLQFLLEAFGVKSTLPTAPSDLYREGCLRLCADEAIRARAGQHEARRLTARQRAAVAKVLAAMAVLTGRRLLLRDDPPVPVDGCLSPRDLVGLRATAEGVDLVIDDRAYAEALTTGLFAPAGADRVRWAHASYADFLAAVALSGRPSEDLQRLLVNTDIAGAFIVPQLRELAVWLSELRPELLTVLLLIEPLLAIQGAARASDAVKASIVDRWLDGVGSGRVHVPWGMFSHYTKLRHPALAEQLTSLDFHGSLTP